MSRAVTERRQPGCVKSADPKALWIKSANERGQIQDQVELLNQKQMPEKECRVVRYQHWHPVELFMQDLSLTLAPSVSASQ